LGDESVVQNSTSHWCKCTLAHNSLIWLVSANEYKEMTPVPKLHVVCHLHSCHPSEAVLVHSFSRGIRLRSQNSSSSSRNKVMDVQSQVDIQRRASPVKSHLQVGFHLARQALLPLTNKQPICR